MKIIAKTFQGLEEVLAKEVIELGADNVEIGNRMVLFTGDKEMLYRANFCLRTAVKVLMPIKEFRATDADEVYEEVRKMEWDAIMDVKNTFLVDSVVFSDDFRHSKFVAYRVKDAIADYFREKTDQRPNVSISNPDFRINVHISNKDVCISLDSSGESLHKRGYRTGTVPAPLNEVLAAGLIMMTGWHGECDLIDPFCGSGTILIEAALIAQNIYPGVFRQEFAFERWKDFDADLFERIYNDDSMEREFDHKIYGYDINRNAVATAIDNVRSAGVNDVVDVRQQDFYEFEQPQEKAIIITNPPYGERITTDDILDLYATIGSRLKQNFAGNDAWILSEHYECFDAIGFRPSTKIAIYNGSLPCEFRKYQVFDGKLKERREEGFDIKSPEERRRNAKFKPLKMREEGKFDGHGWRGEGSRDDEHYFKSRPDKEQPWNKNKKNDRDRKSDRGGFGGKDRNKDRRDDKWAQGQRPERKGGKKSSDKDIRDRRNARANWLDKDRRQEEPEKRFYGDDGVRISRDNFKWGDRLDVTDIREK